MTHGENNFQLQSLTERHKQVASLLAQGLKPGEIAPMVDYTPQYVTMLTRDPLFKLYLSEMIELSEARLEALFCRSVDIVAEGLDGGASENQLKAARLQLEVTGRVGKVGRNAASSEDTSNRLARLAERLVQLLPQQQRGETYNGQAQLIRNAEQT